MFDTDICYVGNTFTLMQYNKLILCNNNSSLIPIAFLNITFNFYLNFRI